MTAIDLPEALATDLRSRRVVAAQIAFRLTAPAQGIGAYASSTALHAPAGLAPRRPDVVVAQGEPPADGVVTTAPLLVVVLAGDPDPAAWLQRGAPTVWVVGPDQGLELTRTGRRRVVAGEELSVEGTGLALRMPWRPGCALAGASAAGQEVG